MSSSRKVHNIIYNDQFIPQVETIDSHMTQSVDGATCVPPCHEISNKNGPHISLGNVKNLMVGNGATMIIGTKPPRKKKEIHAQLPLTNSQLPLTMHQKLDIKDKVGRHWKDLGRRLGFSDSELEQIELDHHKNYSEVIYQILTKWEQRSSQPTQMALAQVFLKIKRGDLADLLSSI